MDPNAAALADPWRVICLCAEWCGVCREWRAQFGQLAAAHPGLHFAWVDIEDEADAMGDVDIETFPTMLVARGDSARFFGPVPPSAAQFSRLLASLLEAAAPSEPPAQATALLKRLGPVLLSK